MGTLELEVPRDREGTFQTSLSERYQRSVSLGLSYNVLHREVCISGFALMDVPW